jgi:hypothetical protein
MRSQLEYNTCKAIATYMRLQYPNVIFHFDLAGLNLSRAQAGMMKAIQGGKGWPDLFIAEPGQRFKYHGLFLEIKPEGTRLLNKTNSAYATEHLFDQAMFIDRLQKKGYKAEFACGFDEAKKVIDYYLNL